MLLAKIVLVLLSLVVYTFAQMGPFSSCDSPLGLEGGAVDNSMINASSESVPNSRLHARLNGNTADAWVPIGTENQWIQVDFGSEHVKLTGIATQGGGASSWVTHYAVSYSNDGIVYQIVKDETGDNTKFFIGNYDTTTTVQRSLHQPITAKRIRIHPTGYNTSIALRFELYGCKAEPPLVVPCDSPLGLENNTIPNTALTASEGSEAWHGRLRGQDAWMPTMYDKNQWIEVRFNSQIEVTGVATQGSPSKAQWVKEYLLKYKNYSEEFKTYNSYRNIVVEFVGNIDQHTIFKHRLNNSFIAATVRLEPKEWHDGIAMRLELYGCPVILPVCWYPFGMANRSIPSPAITASSNMDTDHAADKARLHGNSSWVPVYSYPTPLTVHDTNWIQVDFGSAVSLTGIATQGSGDATESWVKKYKIQTSNDSATFTEYSKVLLGNFDSRTVFTNVLKPPIVARYVRVVPQEVHTGVSLRLEFFGCGFIGKVDGGFSPWSPWSTCTLTCNGGTQVRTRNCTNPTPHYWGQNCNGSLNETRDCNTKICYDRFSEWSSWSPCNETCGPGVQVRKMNFTDNSTDVICHGFLSESRECDNLCCPEMNSTTGFTLWSQWGACNKTCLGMQVRTRSFTDLRLSSKCNNTLSDTGVCNTNCCPVISDLAGFTEWGSFGHCNATCNGYRQRYRKHISSLFASYCHGSLVETRECPSCCPSASDTNAFTTWSVWSTCNASCNGSKARARELKNQEFVPYCPNHLSVTVPCNTLCCPNDSHTASFTSWSSWGACNQTCRGYAKRTRRHKNQASAPCNNTLLEETKCNAICLDDFSEWSSWNTCNVTCGGGKRSRHRNFTDPTTGILCGFSILITQTCNNHTCVNETFTEWSNWTECSATCGEGWQNRTRTCSLSPANCSEPLEERRACNLTACPVHGNFSNWSSWTQCSRTCGTGEQRRERTCSNPSPAHGGNNCTGNTSMTKHCNTHNCEEPVHGNFSNWSNWTQCSRSCGSGEQRRERTCSSPSPAHGGNNCSGNTSETQHCNTHNCVVPTHGNFSQWTSWTTCSLSCGTGEQSRERACNSPSPAHGGNNCTGNTSETQHCNTQACPALPVDGDFTPWTYWNECTVSCGSGTQWRMRTCTNPPPANGGNNCSGTTSQTRYCNTHPCPVHGGWTPWYEWIPCNRPCGGGYENRSRVCTNPTPKHGGRDCEGEGDEDRSCNLKVMCPADVLNCVIKLPNKRCSPNLLDKNSAEYRDLESQVQSNLIEQYKDDLSFKGSKINAIKCGSVIVNFSVFFDSMNSLQIINLQESIHNNQKIHNMPAVLINITTGKVPSSSPTIVTAAHTSSTSIRLEWTHVPTQDLHGVPLGGYNIFYKESSSTSYTPNNMKSVTGHVNHTVVGRLRAYTEYTFRVLAFTSNGNGIASGPATARTDEGVPSQAPPNTAAEAFSTSGIVVFWNHIEAAFIHGVLSGYNVTYMNHVTGETRYKTVPGFILNAVLKGLSRFTRYSVSVCGFTIKGCGPSSGTLLLSTWEDVPTLPPENARAVNLSSMSELTLYWRPVPSGHVNGVLDKYELTIRRVQTAKVEIKRPNVTTIFLSYHVLGYTLRNLKSFSIYEVTITAYTTVGPGPAAVFYGETCRCPRVMPSNYWIHNPYTNLSDTGQISGVFPVIVRDMIAWACGDCVNGHGKTIVNLTSSTARKRTMTSVIANIQDSTAISFPLNGNKDMVTFDGVHPFLPLLMSPGVAFLVKKDSAEVSGGSIFMSLIRIGPMIALSFLLSYLAGICMWFLDSGTEGSCFPRSFVKGTYEGFWWSFISVTTVGYGDRSPVTASARVFAILWTLYGLVLVSLITSAVTTSLTSVTMDTEVMLYGTKVGAIQNSSEHRLGILMNAKMNTENKYTSLEEVIAAMHSGEIRGALMDTYVVAPEKTLFASGDIIVQRTLDRSFGYGMVLSGHAATLQQECRQYMIFNAASISNLVESSTEQLKPPSKSVAETSSTGLFDSKSRLYQNTVLFTGVLLAVGVMAGLTWHFLWHKRKQHAFNNKVNSWKSNSNLVLKRELHEEMKDLVSKFHSSLVNRALSLRHKHKEEILRYCARRKEIRNKVRKKKKKKEKMAFEDEHYVLKMNKLIDELPSSRC